MKFWVSIFLLLIHNIVLGVFDSSKNVLPLSSSQEMHKVLTESDYVCMFFYYKEKKCPQCSHAEELIQTLANENEGIIQVYHVNCQKVQKQISEYKHPLLYCDKKFTHQLPQMTFYKPTQKKIKPYDDYQEYPFYGEASPKGLGKFAHKLLPAYRMRIKTWDDYDEFIKNENKMNKVILFTDRKKTGPIFKALTIHYFGLLHFGEVYNDVENEETQELINDFDVKEFPRIFILTKLHNGECCNREQYDGKMDLGELKNWLDSDALVEKIEYEHPELFIQDKEDTDPFQNKPDVPSNPFTKENYLDKILKEEKPILIHIYKEKQQHLAWDKMKKKYRQTIQQGLFSRNLFEYYELMIGNEEDLNLAKETLGAKNFPTIKFLPIGFAKKKKKSTIFFQSSQEFEDIQKDIMDLIPDKSLGLLDSNHAPYVKSGLQEGRVLVFFFYREGKVGLTYRIMTNLQCFSHYRFYNIMSATDATLRKFQVKKQPEVVGVFRQIKEDEDPDDPVKVESVRLANYQKSMEYDTLKEFLLIFDKDLKKNGKQLHEITTNSSFNEFCGRKGFYCFIGLLDKQKSKTSDELKKQYESYLQTLEKVKNKFQKEMDVYFIYLDPICHNEIIQSLDIDEYPSYIAYIPKKKQYAKMIGRFEFDQLYKFADNFLKKKIQIQNLDNQLIFEDKNCEYQEQQEAPKEEDKSNTKQEEWGRQEQLYTEMGGIDAEKDDL